MLGGEVDDGLLAQGDAQFLLFREPEDRFAVEIEVVGFAVDGQGVVGGEGGGGAEAGEDEGGDETMHGGIAPLGCDGLRGILARTSQGAAA